MIDKIFLGMVWHKIEDCNPFKATAQAGTGTPTSAPSQPCASWGTVLTNSAIIAGTAFFSTLGGTVFTDTTSGIKTLGAASIAAGIAFFTSLSIQRGINPIKPVQ